MTPRRRGALLSLAALLLAACPEAPPPAPTPTGPRPVASLVEFAGAVTTERGPDVSPAQVGPLYRGDVVATGPGAKAVLGDDTGRRLELQAMTRFQVGSSLASLSVDLGDIVFLDEDDAGARWAGARVQTPYGVAQLRDGAAGRLSVVDGGVSLDVVMGAIEFEDVDDTGAKRVRRAGAGERLDVSVGAIEVEDEPPPAPPPTVRFEATAGKPLVRSTKAGRLTPTREPVTLGPGAAWRMPKGAAGRVTGPGYRLEVQPGAAGEVAALEPQGGGSGLTVSAARGPMALHFDGAAPATVSLDGLALSGGGRATAVVTPDGKGWRVEVRAGEVEADWRGGRRRVGAGEVLVLGAKPPGEAQALQPVLTVPIGHLSQVSTTGSRLVALEVPEGGPWRVQVARDAEFRALLVDGPATGQVVVPTQARGELHWRVLNGAGEAGETGRVRFGADNASRRAAQAKTDTVAETGLKATIYFQRVVPTLTFTFTEVPGAAGYRLRIYQAGALKTALVDKQLKQPRAAVESGTLDEGSYLWSASPVDAAGNETAGSRLNKLDIVYDNLVTTLYIASPQNGERAGRTVAASGVAPLGTALRINGRPVKLDAQGRFTATVPGSDTIVFHLKSRGGDSFWVRRLRRE